MSSVYLPKHLRQSARVKRDARGNPAYAMATVLEVAFGATAVLGVGCMGARGALRNKKIARSCPPRAVKWANTPIGYKGEAHNSAEKAVLIADTRALWGGLKEPAGPVNVCSAEDWATILAICEPLAAVDRRRISDQQRQEEAPPVGKETQERFANELPHLKITVTQDYFEYGGDSFGGYWQFIITVEQPPKTGWFGKK